MASTRPWVHVDAALLNAAAPVTRGGADGQRRGSVGGSEVLHEHRPGLGGADQAEVHGLGCEDSVGIGQLAHHDEAVRGRRCGQAWSGHADRRGSAAHRCRRGPDPVTQITRRCRVRDDPARDVGSSGGRHPREVAVGPPAPDILREVDVRLRRSVGDLDGGCPVGVRHRVGAYLRGVPTNPEPVEGDRRRLGRPGGLGRELDADVEPGGGGRDVRRRHEVEVLPVGRSERRVRRAGAGGGAVVTQLQLDAGVVGVVGGEAPLPRVAGSDSRRVEGLGRT